MKKIFVCVFIFALLFISLKKIEKAESAFCGYHCFAICKPTYEDIPSDCSVLYSPLYATKADCIANTSCTY